MRRSLLYTALNMIVEALMRQLLFAALFFALFAGSCSKKMEFLQDYAIQNAAENDEDAGDPAQ